MVQLSSSSTWHLALVVVRAFGNKLNELELSIKDRELYIAYVFCGIIRVKVFWAIVIELEVLNGQGNKSSSSIVIPDNYTVLVIIWHRYG